ncbi:MAG: hypothetical protein EA377_14180, partial [Phycisphaerales bacterium]
LIAVALTGVLLTLLIPALHSARVKNQRDRCADNLATLGQAWADYLEANQQQFPSLPMSGAWQYGGVRHSAINENTFLDSTRPLSRWLRLNGTVVDSAHLFCCPADRGIVGPVERTGTGSRTACRAFGTSYRANNALFDARLSNLDVEPRGVYVHEVNTSPSRLLVMGDAIWYEVAESTGRNADWHRQQGVGNVLFLDGSVRFQGVTPRPDIGPILIDPILREWPTDEP